MLDAFPNTSVISGAMACKHFGRYRSGRVVIEVIAGHGVHYNLISTWRIG